MSKERFQKKHALGLDPRVSTGFKFATKVNKTMRPAMHSLRKIIAVFIAALFILTPLQSAAQFQPSTAKTFIDWPNLQVDPVPGQQSEAMVYAVINDDVALYTIAVRNRTSIAVLGAFQCNKEFTILKTSSNDFYDIRCVDEGMLDNVKTYILTFNGTVYVQDFS